MNDCVLGLFVGLKRPNEMMECTFTLTLGQRRCRRKLVTPALCGQGKNRQRTASRSIPKASSVDSLNTCNSARHCRAEDVCSVCTCPRLHIINLRGRFFKSMQFCSAPSRRGRVHRVHVSTGYTELMGCHNIRPTRRIGEMGERRHFEPSARS
jgi:hypothetical protein